jgi:O-antigen/teichoic acid export membrane protein
MTIAFGLAKIMMMVANALVARHLGRAEFGHGGLIVNGATTIGTFLCLGLPQALNVYCARNPSAKKVEIGMAGLAILGAMTVAVPAITIYPELIAAKLRLTQQELLLALGLSVAFTIYSVLTAIVQGLSLARVRTVAEVALHFVAALSMLAMVYTSDLGLWSIPLGMFLGYVVGACLLLPATVAASKWSFPELRNAPILPIGIYSSLSLLCSIGFLFTYNFQRLQVDRLLDREEVGQYSMISILTIGTAFTFSTVTASLLISKSAASESRMEIYRRIAKSWVYLALPVIAVFIVGQYAVLTVIKYPTPFWPILGFACASLVIMLQTSLGQVMAGHGVHGAYFGVFLSALVAGVTYSSTEWMVPRIGLAGCGWGLCLGYGVCTFVQTFMARWYFSLPESQSSASQPGAQISNL